MLILRVKGGLGNQLYIYSAGQALAAKTGQSVVYDIHTGFRRDPYKRHFLLDQLGLMLPTLDKGQAFTKLTKFKFLRTKRLLFEPLNDPHFAAEVFNNEALQEGEWYLDGYWQQGIPISTEMEQLKTVLPTSVLSSGAQRRVDNPTSVAIHFRLGTHLDEFGAPVAPDNSMDSFDLTYYQSAIAQVEAQQSTIHWVVFADFPNLIPPKMIKRLGDLSFARDYGCKNSLEEWQFLRSFRKMVLSKSTYGWWAGFLSLQPEFIIAPQLPEQAPTEKSKWQFINTP